MPIRNLLDLPTTLDEAVSRILQWVREDTTGDAERLLSLSRRRMADAAHLGVGRWIRNNWGLWTDSPLRDDLEDRFGLYYADDMSSLILGAAWDRYHHPQDEELHARNLSKHLKQLRQNRKRYDKA